MKTTELSGKSSIVIEARVQGSSLYIGLIPILAFPLEIFIKRFHRVYTFSASQALFTIAARNSPRKSIVGTHVVFTSGA